MPDAAELLKIIKRVAVDVVHSLKLPEVCFGRVVSASPLKITVEQKLTLSERQLILSRNVTEYTFEMTVDHFTEKETEHVHAVHDTYTGGGASSPTEHLHAYKGRKKFIVHNGLRVGENVVLIRQQGGQKYLVVDRV